MFRFSFALNAGKPITYNPQLVNFLLTILRFLKAPPEQEIFACTTTLVAVSPGNNLEILFSV